MSRRLRLIFAALGLTAICLAGILEPLVRSSHTLVYHWSGQPCALFGPPVLEFLVLFLALSAILLSAEHPGIWRSAVWTGIAVTLPWVVVHQIQQIWSGMLPQWFHLPPVWVAILLWPVLTALCMRFPAHREEFVDIASMVLAFVALSSALVMGQLLWFWWDARGLNQPVALHTPSAMTTAASGKPRIIIILMDELSYRQVYGHRYAGIQLPAFDALAADSAVFTQVTPTANFTEAAIPSLLSGESIFHVNATAHGMLQYRSADDLPWRPFDERETVFQDALNAGEHTTVVGWYNPYCRIMRDVLDSCYWTDAYTVKNGLTPEGNFDFNLISSTDTLLHGPKIREFLARTLHLPIKFNYATNNVHLDDFVHLDAAADKVLLERSSGFTFIHLPIPHPNGIYNRRTGKLTANSSTYLDNLALADRSLGHMRQLLEQSGQWDSSVVMVMGDHGWRTTLLWEATPQWTREEQRASLGGTFDPRPAYIVKLAGETSGVKIDVPFKAIRTRALIDAMLAEKVRTTDELKLWVANQVTPRALSVTLDR